MMLTEDGSKEHYEQLVELLHTLHPITLYDVWLKEYNLQCQAHQCREIRRPLPSCGRRLDSVARSDCHLPALAPLLSVIAVRVGAKTHEAACASFVSAGPPAQALNARGAEKHLTGESRARLGAQDWVKSDLQNQRPKSWSCGTSTASIFQWHGVLESLRRPGPVRGPRKKLLALFIKVRCDFPNG